MLVLTSSRVYPPNKPGICGIRDKHVIFDFNTEIHGTSTNKELLSVPDLTN